MKAPPPRRNLKGCTVYVGDAMYVGFLLFETDQFVVLLNNVRGGADLGPLKLQRDHHLNPECDITVFPRWRVTRTATVEEAK